MMDCGIRLQRPSLCEMISACSTRNMLLVVGISCNIERCRSAHCRYRCDHTNSRCSRRRKSLRTGRCHITKLRLIIIGLLADLCPWCTASTRLDDGAHWQSSTMPISYQARSLPTLGLMCRMCVGTLSALATQVLGRRFGHKSLLSSSVSMNQSCIRLSMTFADRRPVSTLSVLVSWAAAETLLIGVKGIAV